MNRLKKINNFINLEMKKFSLLTNEQVRKHLANTSTAKVTHVFPKAKRFSNPNPEYVCFDIGVKKPAIWDRPHLFPRDEVASVLGKGLILLRTRSFLLVPRHINSDHSSTS